MTTTAHLIREAIADTKLADPREIAAIVADRTPEDEVRGFYAKMLVQEVRGFLSAERRNVFSQAKDEPTVGKSGMKALSGARTRATVARDWWAEFTATKVHVGDQVWKELGDCNSADCRALYEERMAHAERVTKEAQPFGQLSKMLDAIGVESIRELDAAKVKAVFV